MAMTDYATQLFDRFILPHYDRGIKVVHMIFNIPNPKEFNPKNFEQQSRDKKNEHDHKHIRFLPITSVPKNWRVHVECRTCKQSIIQALGLSYLEKAKSTESPLLKGDQILVLAGCFSGHANKIPAVLSGNMVIPLS
jgi:hypothetical protein